MAGNIMWARQLLRRIEGPMSRFAQNKALMGLKESKKVIRNYNRVSAVGGGVRQHRQVVRVIAG